MALKKFTFNVAKNDGYARLGKITTHRGPIDTPAFMPVGTQGTVKGTFIKDCLLYTSPSPRDVEESRMPSSA